MSTKCKTKHTRRHRDNTRNQVQGTYAQRARGRTTRTLAGTRQCQDKQAYKRANRCKVHAYRCEARAHRDMRCKHPDKGTGRARGPCHDCCACAGCGAWLVLLEALMFRTVLAETRSLRPGAARPIASARVPENAHMRKAQVYGPSPGTGSPRSAGAGLTPCC
mmetsp:Transcript_96790/g.156161  ORF Transcript_96790/g.156161 Transcript_96790/m.156161 type:complete len:163 (-) Transcript_96790:242-730(-)